jgi:hypothetical protein
MRVIGSEASNKSLEVDIERNVDELKQAVTAPRQSENGNNELSENNLDVMLARVSESPRREIENLISELQALHNKLETNRSRLHCDIVEYAGKSQQVMQLTTIISDSVKSMPINR